MQQLPRESPASHELQIQALREALERASRAAANSESVVTQVRNDLRAERQRNSHAAAELLRTSQELKQALADNQRLRRTIGEFHRERLTLAERIRELAENPPGEMPMGGSYTVEFQVLPPPPTAS